MNIQTYVSYRIFQTFQQNHIHLFLIYDGNCNGNIDNNIDNNIDDNIDKNKNNSGGALFNPSATAATNSEQKRHIINQQLAQTPDCKRRSIFRESDSCNA